MAKQAEKNKNPNNTEDTIFDWLGKIVVAFILLFCYYKFILKSENAANEASSKTIKKEIKNLNILDKTSRILLEGVLVKDTIKLSDIFKFEPFLDDLQDIDYASSDGTTLLIAIAKAKNNEFIPHAKDKYIKLISKVLSKKPNLNHTDTYGRTALIWNTINGLQNSRRKNDFFIKQDVNYYFEKKLLENEAARKIADNSGKTAIQYAVEFNSEAYISLLSTH